jgi:hypothetical protein
MFFRTTTKGPRATTNNQPTNGLTFLPSLIDHANNYDANLSAAQKLSYVQTVPWYKKVVSTTHARS